MLRNAQATAKDESMKFKEALEKVTKERIEEYLKILIQNSAKEAKFAR